MTLIANSLAVASFVVLIALLTDVPLDWRQHISFFHDNSSSTSSASALPDLPPMPVLTINPAEVDIDVTLLQKEIDDLATFSDTPPPAVTRLVFSEADVAARRFVKRSMEAAGLLVREDAIGNIFGRWQGSDPLLPAVLSGSHIDAIPHSGKFDGVVGVLGAIAAVRALKQAGFTPLRSIDVIMFTTEEPTRFGLGCMGSRLMSGQSGLVAHLSHLSDASNITVVQAAVAAGYEAASDPANLHAVRVEEGMVASFVELHIEQGPLLEAKGVAIGVVSHIAAPSSVAVDLRGEGGHAGAVLMGQRSDAGLAAAELSLAVEAAVLSTRSADTVGTVGHVVVHPNAINSIPLHVHLEIDIRDIDGPRRDSLLAVIRQQAEAIAARRRVKLERFDIINADDPVAFSPVVMSAVTSAAEELDLSHMSIISRAYHDAPFMAKIAPTGMIFVPCHRGISHNPEESVTDLDLRNGVRVLAIALAKLSFV